MAAPVLPGRSKGDNVNGFMKVQLGVWADAARSAAGMVWPIEWSMIDLDYWGHAVTHHGQMMPSYAQLAERWGCSRAAARARVGRWRSVTSHPDHTHLTATSQSPHSHLTATSQLTLVEAGESGRSDHSHLTPRSPLDHSHLTPGSHPPHSGLESGRLTMADRHPKKEEEEVKKEEEEEQHTQGADAPAVPVWARNVKGAKPAQAVEGVAAIVSAIRGQPTTPAKTTAAPVLALYRATELPWLDFVASAVLVAEAAHQCPDRLFARDVRAEDWPDGTDRQRDVATVCRHDRWQVRLDAARAWDEAGRPTAGHGAAVGDGRVPRTAAQMRSLGSVYDTMNDKQLEAYAAKHGAIFDPRDL